MSKKYTLLTFKGICMNFLLELKFFILSHPVTSKQPREIVQIHMHHPVFVDFKILGRISNFVCIGFENMEKFSQISLCEF